TRVLAEHGHLLHIEEMESFLLESCQELIGRPPTAKESASWGDRLRAGVDRLKRDFLRRLIVDVTPCPQPPSVSPPRAPLCHSERSEESLHTVETLRCAQGDKGDVGGRYRE